MGWCFWLEGVLDWKLCLVEVDIWVLLLEVLYCGVGLIELVGIGCLLVLCCGICLVKLVNMGCLLVVFVGCGVCLLLGSGCLLVVIEYCSGCLGKLIGIGCWLDLIESCVVLLEEDIGCIFWLFGIIGCSILLVDVIDLMLKFFEMRGLLIGVVLVVLVVLFDVVEDFIGSIVFSDVKWGFMFLIVVFWSFWSVDISICKLEGLGNFWDVIGIVGLVGVGLVELRLSFNFFFGLYGVLLLVILFFLFLNLIFFVFGFCDFFLVLVCWGLLLVEVVFFCWVCVKMYCWVCFWRFSNCCFCVLREGIDDLLVEIGEFIIILEDDVIDGVEVLEVGEVLVGDFKVFFLVWLVLYWNIILLILVGGELCSLFSMFCLLVGFFLVFFLLLLVVFIFVELVCCFGGGDIECWLSVCGCLNRILDWIMILRSIWGWGLFNFGWEKNN